MVNYLVKLSNHLDRQFTLHTDEERTKKLVKFIEIHIWYSLIGRMELLPEKKIDKSKKHMEVYFAVGNMYLKL